MKGATMGYILTLDESPYADLLYTMNEHGLNRSDHVHFCAYSVQTDLVGSYVNIVAIDNPEWQIQVWAPRYNTSGENEWVFVYGDLGAGGMCDWMSGHAHPKALVARIVDFLDKRLSV